MQIKREYIGALLIIFATLGSFSVGFLIEDIGTRAVCRNGYWEEYNLTHYQCSVNDRIEICHHLSSTSKTCYIGKISNIIIDSCDLYKVCTRYRDFKFDSDCFTSSLQNLENNFIKTDDPTIYASENLYSYKVVECVQ